MWAALCVKLVADAADAKQNLVSNNDPENVSRPRPQLVLSGDYENAERSTWRKFCLVFSFFSWRGWGVSETEAAGLLTFRGGASIVVLLSNHTESSCVRCITAARYATYGIEKSELDNPGRATAGVTYCVQNHP